MKEAIVTGANRGIGFAVAKGLLEKGFRVCLAVRDPKKGAAAAAKLGPGAWVLAVDLSNEKSMLAFAKEFGGQASGLDVLVNNGGIIDETPLSEVGAASLMNLFQVNAVGAFVLTKALAGIFRKGARVVNISSRLGQLSSMGGGYPAYSISKAALNAVTRNLAAHLAPKGVDVNAMCPGWVRTDMGGPSAPLSPEEGADTALYLAAELGPGNTGKFYAERKAIPW